MKKPAAVYILALLHLLLGCSAAAGGTLLLLNTDGSLLGMEPGWLSNSPFSSYLIPGIFLLVINGIVPLLVCGGLLKKPAWKWPQRLNIYKDRHWAWTFSLYCGITVIAWIIIQQLITRYFWLQPAVAATGLCMIIFTMLPSVMKYFKVPPVMHLL